jgi:hypothetical protein
MTLKAGNPETACEKWCVGRRIHSPLFLNGPMSDNPFLMARYQEKAGISSIESNR